MVLQKSGSDHKHNYLLDILNSFTLYVTLERNWNTLEGKKTNKNPITNCS